MFIPAQISPPSFGGSADAWIWFVGVIFLAGGQYFSLRNLGKRVENLEGASAKHALDRTVHKTTEDVEGIVRGVLAEPGTRRN